MQRQHSTDAVHHTQQTGRFSHQDNLPVAEHIDSGPKWNLSTYTQRCDQQQRRHQHKNNGYNGQQYTQNCPPDRLPSWTSDSVPCDRQKIGHPEIAATPPIAESLPSRHACGENAANAPLASHQHLYGVPV